MAIYHIGFTDDGTPLGISDEDLKSSIESLKLMAAELNCKLEIKETNQGKSHNSADNVTI